MNSFAPIKKDLQNLTREDLDALIHKTAPAIVIENFFSKSECLLLSKKITDRVGSTAVSRFGNNDDTGYLGIAAVKMIKEKELYLQKVDESASYLSDISSDARNPVDEVLKLLNDLWEPGAKIAIENTHPLFAGIIRIIAKAGIHADFAKRFMTGWNVFAELTHQLSWNVYLQPPIIGGNLIIYDKQPARADDVHYDPRLRSYNSSVVSGRRSITLQPKVGSLIIFDSRLYHEITKARGWKKRITIGSFIGMTDSDSPLILWS